MLQFVTIAFILEVFILAVFGYIVLLIFIAIPFLLLYLNMTIASKFEQIASLKGYGKEIHSFAMCFWLGIVGYLYVIALPDLKREAQIISIASRLNSNLSSGNDK